MTRRDAHTEEQWIKRESPTLDLQTTRTAQTGVSHPRQT
jgi:hypothetical protein